MKKGNITLNNMKLKDKVALVLGGTGDVGSEIVRALEKRGSDL